MSWCIPVSDKPARFHGCFFFRQAGARDLLLTMLNRKDSMKFDGNSLWVRGSEGWFFQFQLLRWIWPNILTYEKRVLSCVELQIINNYFLALYFKLNGTMFHVLNMSCTLQIIKSVGNLSAIWLQTICKYSRPQPTPLLVEAGFLQILPSLSIGNDDIYFYHHHHDQIHHHYQQQHHQYQQQHNNNDHCQHHHHCHYFVSIRNSSFKTQHSQRPVLPSPSTPGRLSGGKIADGWGD